MNEAPANFQQSTNVASDSMVKQTDNKEGRKQLPTILDSVNTKDTSVSSESKLETGSKHKTGYSPYFLEYSILAEYTELRKKNVPGMYVLSSSSSPLIWHGMLFIRQGMYQGGVFRFTMTIPENYPDGDCPKVVFDVPVYHPIVEIQSGELDVKRAFPKWRRNSNKLWQVLLYARRIFYKIDTKAPLNLEAAVLYETNPDMFKSKVSECVVSSKNHLFDPVNNDDPNNFRFTPWDPRIHEDVHDQMLNLQKNNFEDESYRENPRGLSWMDSNKSGDDLG